MDEATNNDNEESNELSEIYKIFKEIYLKAIPVLKDLSHNSIDIDYREWIDEKNKIDFNKIDQKFQDKKYSSMTDVIKDIRLVFLNCYKFYGTKSDHTKQSLQLEELLEQEISCLNENFKPLADIQLTLNLLNLEENSTFKFRYPKDCYDSILLRRVAHCRPDRLKEYHTILSTTFTNDDCNIHTLDELTSWGNEIWFNKNYYQCISSMCELPEIGNFMAIIFKAFDIDIINQAEIERMFLMPKESTTMSKIMTVLLMPIKRNKVIEQIMPYSVWSKKLSKKVSDWYKVYHIKNRNKVNVMSSLGIHPDFWTILGDRNPLVEYDYCELSYFMKIWLIKGLCDYITIKYKTINNIITNYNEGQCTCIWKNDMETEEYFFFNLMPDLRIYYHNITYNEPSLEFLEIKNGDEEKMFMNDMFSINGIPTIFHSESRVKSNQNHFKLIADSVQGLRSFLEELDIEDTSVPENLITSLENFINKIEQEECNLIILNNNSKIKLFKDWKSYSESIDKDITVLRGKQELKSISQGLRQEIILEKRKRKVVVKQGFDNEITFDSDEYFTETDGEQYTDSEDEWGAMNQPKKKSNQSIQTHSKLKELEKRLKEECKIPKPINKTNILVNGHNEKFICSDIIKSEQIKIKNVSSGEEVMSTITETEENKNACKKQKYIMKSDKCIIEQPDLKKMKLNILESREIVTIDDYKFDNSKLIEKKSSIKKTKSKNKKNKQNHSDKIVISGDNDVQILSAPPKSQNTSVTSRNQNKQIRCTNIQPAKCFEKLNGSHIINNSEQIKYISSGKEVISTFSNMEENRNACTKQNDVIESDNFINKRPDLKKLQSDILEGVEIVTIDDKLDNCKLIEKKSSIKRTKSKNKKNKQNHSDKIVISNDNDDVQILSAPPQSQNTSVTSRNQNKQINCTNIQPAKYFEKLNGSHIINNSEQIKNISSGKEMKLNILENREIVTIDEDELDNCKLIEKKSSEKIVNDKNHCKNNVETIISIEDDNDNDKIVITDDVQIFSNTSRIQNTSVIPRAQNNSITPRIQNNSVAPRIQNNSITPRIQNNSITPRIQNNTNTPRIQNNSITPRIQSLPVKINRSYSFNNSQSSTLTNKPLTTANFTKKTQVITTSMQKLSPDVTIMPANVHLPKGIEVTMIKSPPTTINSHFNNIKRSTTMSNGYPINNPTVVNVKCKIMSEPNHKGEVTFYVSLPNGEKHNVSNEMMNQYLREHNNILPDYLLVPLSIEVAKQYGFH